MTPRAVVIVGAGLAGARAAETLRAEGYDGRVLLVGEEPVAPYERPALSKKFLAGTRDEESLLLRKPGFWESRGIELMLGRRVETIDPTGRIARTSRGEELAFDALVVATGARPRRLPFDVPAGVRELRTLADAKALREELSPGTRLAVVGGGFVGAEVASTARSLGVEVTIVEAAPAPVARILGNAVGHMLAARWRDHGIDVRLRTGVSSLRADAMGRVDSVVLTDGSELRADVVLVGVGVEPVRELLLERPALHVHPAGDVVGPGHWTAAAHDGAAAARRILGLPVAAPPPHYVWSDQFGLRLQIVGSPNPDDRLQADGDDDSFAVRYLGPDGRTRAALLANRPAEAAEIRRLLADEALACAA
ncbi:MAG TPA: FAD-dependent oxidoreductase [Gaiellaceae bacterium]|nr:FAD-dependent oxidoreductase [Gaiellaceae bacterium]